jgi:hypothetical protein
MQGQPARQSPESEHDDDRSEGRAGNQELGRTQPYGRTVQSVRETGDKGAAHGNTAEKCGQDDSKRTAVAPNHISKNSRPVNLSRRGGKSGQKRNQGRCLYLALDYQV